ncbi:DUF4012 domain-containing protein [Actinotalea solisilvae]|uniref:DUF4012 domain-containing protein n=1 Tax=Actinotalea solisilvae TaxID=2072922 RepID=UPI0018F1B253|nr:DUF4012 domain-containing protein [Actinotalea solisilvae]
MTDDAPRTRRSVRDDPPVRHATGASVRARRRPSTRRTVTTALVVAVPVLLVAWAAWLGLDALRARSELQSAAALVTTLQQQVLDGDRAAAGATLADLQDHASRAHDAAHGPHWSAARVLPWVGPNVAAVQVVSEVVDGLAVRALPGLMDATALVDPAGMAPVDGRVPIGPLEEAAPVVVAADAEVRAARDRVEGLDVAGLWAPLRGPVEDLAAQVRGVASTTSTAAKAVQLLPPMLGADGPRHYVLLVQNTAEPRATGGIPGAVILLEADGGAVRVVDQRSGPPLVDLPAPVLPLTPAETALFGADLAADMRDVTFTPDFPRTAEIARALWQQEVGGPVDGVLSVDPGTLALLLGATGPVPLPPGPVADAVGGVLTADNAEDVLLNTVYRVLPVADQDPFFASTAAGVFAALAGGQGDAAAAVEALAEAARRGSLMVWSALPDEQALLAGTVLSGELTGESGDSPVVGVFLNQGNADKMGYYLGFDIEVVPGDCLADGARRLEVVVILRNDVPGDPAQLPAYITGTDPELPVGHMQTNVLVYAPEGGLVDEVVASAGEPGVTSQVHDGLAVVGRTVRLAPGESQVITYTLATGPDQDGIPMIRTTPAPNRVTSVQQFDSAHKCR